MRKNQKPRILQKNNCTGKFYNLNLKDGYASLDIGQTTDLREFNIDEILFDAYKSGEKLFDNIKKIIKETEIDGDIIEKIEDLNINDSVARNIEYINEWCEKYGFPTSTSSNSNSIARYSNNNMPINDISTFSKNLMIFYILYSFHLNFVFLYNAKLEYYKSKDEIDILDYVENQFKVKLNNINILGPLFIKDFKKLNLNVFLEEKEMETIIKDKKQRLDFLDEFKLPYLKRVNEISYNLKNSIISIIDIENKVIDISSENIFHLIWHIFINYIILDTKPSKICECKICHTELIQTGSKKPTRCKEHENTGRQEEKDIKKKELITILLKACEKYNINDTYINTIKKELLSCLKKGHSKQFRNLNLGTIKEYKRIIANYIKTNNLHKK